ncbi:MAG: hypothetical protein KDA86_24145 [Planctomycetaceae bacterium]|nr:hypothetical protein [Planctomycetaceae bacterium]
MLFTTGFVTDRFWEYRENMGNNALDDQRKLAHDLEVAGSNIARVTLKRPPLPVVFSCALRQNAVNRLVQ